MLLNVPPARIQTVSPYNTGQPFQTTKFNLDMRRKAEVLKYTPTQSSSQTNSLTQKQKFTKAVGLSYRKNGLGLTTLRLIGSLAAGSNIVTVTSTTALAVGNTVNIPSIVTGDVILAILSSTTFTINLISPTTIASTMIIIGQPCPVPLGLRPTPTSSCDVPGPVMMLYDDETVPLYNYSTNVDAYGIIPSKVTPVNKVTLYPNVVCPAGVPTNIGYVYMNYLQPNQMYPVQVSAPASLYFSGINGGQGAETASVGLTSLSLLSYYSGNLVNTNNIPSTGVFYSTTQATITIPLGSTLQTRTSALGLVRNDNLQVLAISGSGIIYDLYLTPNMSFSTQGIWTTPTYGLIFNTTS
jgi:hypothetical protein